MCVAFPFGFCRIIKVSHIDVGLTKYMHPRAPLTSLIFFTLVYFCDYIDFWGRPVGFDWLASFLMDSIMI